MKEEVDKILHEADKVAVQETTHLSSKFRDAAIHGRASRYIKLAENSAADEYYKKYGGSFDKRGSEYSPKELLGGKVFIYTMVALTANLVLYLPAYFLLVWGGVNKHDAAFVAVIINTAISTIAWGLLEEKSMKHSAYKAGMRAEAENHIVGKYHIAKNKIDSHYTAKGHLPDYDFDWKE